MSYYALVYAYKSHQMSFSKFNIDLDGINAKYPFHAEKLVESYIELDKELEEIKILEKKNYLKFQRT